MEHFQIEVIDFSNLGHAFCFGRLDYKSGIFSMIDTMLTKKKFKDFFNKNVAML